MKSWMLLLFGAIALSACDSDSEVGEACDELDDCESGLICVFDDPNDPESGGACAEDITGDTDTTGDTDV